MHKRHNIRKGSEDVMDTPRNLSVYCHCFFMKNGTKLYLPMSHDAKSGVGDFIVLSEAEIVTLMKKGESNIQRIRG